MRGIPRVSGFAVRDANKLPKPRSAHAVLVRLFKMDDTVPFQATRLTIYPYEQHCFRLEDLLAAGARQTVVGWQGTHARSYPGSIGRRCAKLKRA